MAVEKSRIKPAGKSVAKRLALLEDHAAIIDAVYRYHHAFNEIDILEWLDCFTDDAVFRSVGTDGSTLFALTGRAEFESWITQRTIDWPTGTEGYTLGNPRVVKREENSAEVTSIFVTLQCRAGGEAPLSLRSYGTYKDRLVRCADGRWRIGVKEGKTLMTNTKR